MKAGRGVKRSFGRSWALTARHTPAGSEEALRGRRTGRGVQRRLPACPQSAQPTHSRLTPTPAGTEHAGERRRRSHPDRDTHKRASQKDVRTRIAPRSHAQPSTHALQPPPARQTTHPSRLAAAARAPGIRTPAARLGVHGDGGDGGVHLVAHEVCELNRVPHPLLCALWRPVARIKVVADADRGTSVKGIY